MHGAVVQPAADQRVPVEARAGHVDHAVARDCGWGSVVDVVHLKNDLAVGRHRNSVAVGEGECLVVVQHRVQVLNPDCVDGAVQDQPDVLTLRRKMNNG